MTLYQQPKFTCPTVTIAMSDALYKYRVGLITAEEYEKMTGQKPDQEVK